MSKKVIITICIVLVLLAFIVFAIMRSQSATNIISEDNTVEPINEILTLKSGLSTVKYDGDYGFEDFLEQGGAKSDSDVINFLSQNISKQMSEIKFDNSIFGCSTISVKADNGDNLFGRNFDWNHCNTLVVVSEPQTGYSSISTVNMDFITSSGGVASLINLSNNIKTIASLYAPLDGMNEKGLCVAVNMIQDGETINQNTAKPDITTTTAIRLLLNKASNVDEALNLLESYDMHASMNYMIHFAISDNTGKSVAVEYVNNEMVVIETPILTNFYLAEGEKQGVGTSQSHTRYEILQERLSTNNTMSMDDVRDSLDSVSKKNFGEFESTEWSIVFNQSTGDVRYYHRENYNEVFSFKLAVGKE